MPYEYLDAAELAAIIRRDLKAAFPAVKFSVRSSKYSMGSSVNVRWADGPTSRAVDAVVDRYKAQGFDGMTDSTTNSGPVTLDDGRVVKITPYIFASREVSETLKARVTAWYRRNYSGLHGDQEQEIYRLAYRSQVINNCLFVGK